MIKIIHLALITFILVLGACSSTPHPIGKPLPSLSFTHLNPYSPYNGAVEIRQSAKLNERTKVAISEFVKAPEALIKQYAQSRFVTAGRPVKSIFDIEKLSLNKKTDADNIMGILSGAAADYYTLDLLIAIYPLRNGQATQPYTITIKRELLIPDQSSLAEKEIRQFEFLERIIADIDKTVTGFMPHMR